MPVAAATPAWSITPDVTVTGTYNDNPTLAASSDARGDFITQVSPGLRIDGRGPRFRANLNYRPSAIFYARNSGDNDFINTLSAFGNLEAIERFFFVEATGNIAQNFISPLGPRPADITTITPNRAETRTFGLSPYVRGEIGRGYAYELRNRNNWTSTNNEVLGDVQNTIWSARLSSPVRLFGWALDFEDSKLRYESEGISDRSDRESRLARGTIYMQPDPSVRLSASAGRERNNYALGEAQSSSTRGAGITWTPTVRTTADLQYERRFFGPSRLARFQHRTRLTAWNVSYSRSTSDFQQELLRLPPGNTAALLDVIFAARVPDPAERQAAVDQFLRTTGTPSFLSGPLAFYTQQIFLQERLEVSAGLLGVRNSLTFTVFTSDSNALSEGLVGAVPDAFLAGSRIRQIGFGVRADHRLTPFTSIGASANRTKARQEEPSVSDSVNDSLALTLNHTLSPRTTAFGGVSLTNFETSGAGSSGQEARTAFVGVNHRF
jgi:uncharacterized protein (PEP-CTERM system associated)